MKLTYITAAFIGSFLLFSCGGNESTTDTDEVISEDTVITETTIETTTEPAPHDLVMIDNQKWAIDEGMKLSIDSIEMRMTKFNGQTLEDYAYLSNDLAHHTKSVISSCTMKGQAHDELHKWLLPFIDLRKSIDSIEQVSEGDAIAEEIKSELAIFDTYFE